MKLGRKEVDRVEKRIRKDERKRVRRKRGARKSIYGTGILVLLILILLGSGYIGVDPIGFRGDASGEFSLIKKLSKNESEETSKRANQAENVKIIVEDEVCYYNQVTYDLEGIKEQIELMEETDNILDLVDKVAEAKFFAEIEKILQNKGIEYNIIEEY